MDAGDAITIRLLVRAEMRLGKSRAYPSPSSQGAHHRVTRLASVIYSMRLQCDAPLHGSVPEARP
jgi:hypothetical protein